MRTRRILGRNRCFYHVICRVNHGDYLLDDPEKERIVRLLREAESLGLGRVVTYAILNTHLHILVMIDHDVKVAEETVIKRVRTRYGDARADKLLMEMKRCRESDDEAAAQAVLDRYRGRMNNLAEFMKDVLQRYTMSYNKRNSKFGRFWSDRYKSLIVESKAVGDVVALAVIAGYIDLNAVRAHIVTDPGKYRFCGYGAALGGDKDALQGLAPVLAMLRKSGKAGLAAYRVFLFRQGLDSLYKRSITEEFRRLASKVADKKGRLSPAELLLCRVRYFSDGVAIGSRGFIEELFANNRHLFSPLRKDGARSFRGADSGGLFGMRDLRVNPISVPKAE